MTAREEWEKNQSLSVFCPTCKEKGAAAGRWVGSSASLALLVLLRGGKTATQLQGLRAARISEDREKIYFLG